ncbi:hypothetical protein BDF14DRAFT_1794229 [Spinellus fusiger]|nr:hypothetical protein BDF14DRAFT_1794229 [Spinellus fusiger]
MLSFLLWLRQLQWVCFVYKYNCTWHLSRIDLQRIRGRGHLLLAHDMGNKSLDHAK